MTSRRRNDGPTATTPATTNKRDVVVVTDVDRRRRRHTRSRCATANDGLRQMNATAATATPCDTTRYNERYVSFGG